MKRIMLAFVWVLSFSLVVLGQCQQKAPPAQPPAASSQANAAAQTPAPANDGKTRLYVSDSESWEASGGWGKPKGDSAGSVKAGPSATAAEFMKNLNENCPRVIITDDKDRAKYALIIYRAGTKGKLVHQNKISILNRQSDVIFSDSTHKVGNSTKDACLALEKAENK